MSGLAYRPANTFASRATNERIRCNNYNNPHLNPIQVQS